MEHAVKAIEANLVSRCMVKVYDWSKHAANNCKVNIVTPSPAKHFTHAYIYIYIFIYAGVHIIQCRWTKISRYPAKKSMDIAQTKNRIQHIEQIAPQKLISSNEHPAVSANQVLSVAEMLLCAICQKTLDQPIQLSCDTVVCTGCLVHQLTASAQTFCPFCSPPHQLTPETIKPASQMILRLLQDVLVKCMTCKRDGAFIGNHVNRALQVVIYTNLYQNLHFLLLQPSNIATLCSSV